MWVSLKQRRNIKLISVGTLLVSTICAIPVLSSCSLLDNYVSNSFDGGNANIVSGSYSCITPTESAGSLSAPFSVGLDTVIEWSIVWLDEAAANPFTISANGLVSWTAQTSSATYVFQVQATAPMRDEIIVSNLIGVTFFNKPAYDKKIADYKEEIVKINERMVDTYKDIEFNKQRYWSIDKWGCVSGNFYDSDFKGMWLESEILKYLNGKLKELEGKMSGLEADRVAVNNHIAAVITEMKSEIADLQLQLIEKISAYMGGYDA